MPSSVKVAVEQRLIAQRHRAQAGAAELIDVPGRALHRNAGGDRGLTGRVLALRGGQNLMITSETRPGSMPARSSAALIATAPRSWAGMVANAQLKLPTGVRAALTMTTSTDMDISWAGG